MNSASLFETANKAHKYKYYNKYMEIAHILIFLVFDISFIRCQVINIFLANKFQIKDKTRNIYLTKKTEK